MATHTGSEFIAVSEDTRRVVRELRTQLGLSRATVEKRAKVGTDYIKRLELGQHPHVEATRVRRVLQVMQQAAARAGLRATDGTVGARGESRRAAEQTGSAVKTRAANQTPPRTRRQWNTQSVTRHARSVYIA